MDTGNGPGQWVVTFPLTGTGYTFSEGMGIDPGYVAEKVGNFRKNSQHHYNSPDIHEMVKIITMIVPHTTSYARTDETGHFPDDYSLRAV